MDCKFSRLKFLCLFQDETEHFKLLLKGLSNGTCVFFICPSVSYIDLVTSYSCSMASIHSQT